MFKRFTENWNYGKHAIAVTGIFTGIFLIGNGFLGKKVEADKKTLNPISRCKNMSTGQIVFNGILTALYTFEMSGTYIILKKIGKKINEF